jgi:hypothetical protein
MSMFQALVEGRSEAVRCVGWRLELAVLLGAYPNVRSSLAYGEPTTVVNGNEQTVSMDAAGNLPPAETTAVDIVEAVGTGAAGVFVDRVLTPPPVPTTSQANR